MNPFTLGAIMILVGFGLTALILLVSHWYSQRQANAPEPMAAVLPKDVTTTSDAVLLVQVGGRVLYSNQQAKEIFRHQEDAPNLERLARSTHPSEAFLQLCATEGQARFYLNGRLVEGISYGIPGWGKNGSPSGSELVSRNVMLVALRRPQVANLASGEGSVSDQALGVFAELSQAMASSLDFEKTLQKILESVERLIPTDTLEITIWDPNKQNLVPYRFVGTTDVDRHVEKAAELYSADTGYSGYLVTHRKPLNITDVDAFREVRPAVDRKQYPYSSYLGMPLQIAGELVGTLELASLNKEAFSENDLENLRILSGQAGVTLKNSLLFLEEQKRVLELSGLAKLAQAVGALGDTKDLYERLVDGISTLLQVKTLGFLIYQESQRLLVAQKPFIGIPAPMLELFRVTIPSASPAEEILTSNEAILAQNAPEDERIITLGLDHMAVAAGIQNTILVPLTTAGRQLGYLQVADKKDGLPFDQDDLRILTIITSQVATIIENATLVKESQERAQRSEALRRVASLAASVATLDEILSFSLREIAQLLRADAGLIYLLDENIGELAVHKESLFGIAGELVENLRNIEMTDPQFHRTVTASQTPFLTGNLHEANEFNPI
jgi:GAF domain-containing protein